MRCPECHVDGWSETTPCAHCGCTLTNATVGFGVGDPLPRASAPHPASRPPEPPAPPTERPWWLDLEVKGSQHPRPARSASPPTGLRYKASIYKEVAQETLRAVPGWAWAAAGGGALLVVVIVGLYFAIGDSPSRAEVNRLQAERVERLETRLKEKEPWVERDERLRKGFGIEGESPLRENYREQQAQYEREKRRLEESSSDTPSGLKKLLVGILVIVVILASGFMAGSRK